MQKIIQQIAKHFQINSTKIIVEPILHGKFEKKNVYRLKIRYKHYLLKIHEITESVSKSGYTPFQIEKFTLTTLRKNAGLVPNIIWYSEKLNALLLEWRGDNTLDSIAQSKWVTDRMSDLNTVMDVLFSIEEIFKNKEEEFQPYTYRFDYKHNLQNILEQAEKTISYLEQISNWSLTSRQEVQLEKAWQSLSTRLIEAKPVLGVLDYQARNIVFDGELPYFIDFASIGWDWQERRLVQYFNSIGAYQDESNFIFLLNRELVDKYAVWVTNHRERCSPKDIAARLDGHHLLLYLSIMHKLLTAVSRPDSINSKILLDAWGDARLRFQHAISIIINTELSEDFDMNYIRMMIRKFQGGEVEREPFQ